MYMSLKTLEDEEIFMLAAMPTYWAENNQPRLERLVKLHSHKVHNVLTQWTYIELCKQLALAEKATIHRVTMMLLTTSKIVLNPGQNHLLNHLY